MQYLFAYFVLLAFPFYAAYLFRRHSRAAAAATAVLVGTLFLPENVGFDLPVIPPLDKEGITYLSVLLAVLFYQRPALRTAHPGRGPEAIVLVLMLTSVGTMLANPQPVFADGRLQDGLGLYWLFARFARDALDFALPFVLGRAMFRSMDDLETLLRVFTSLGLIYAVLIFVEVLLSIPFRTWFLAPYFYGGAPSTNWRWGGPQPIVFVAHALELAVIMASAAIAAAALAKAKRPAAGLGFKLSWTSLHAALFFTRNVTGNIYGLLATVAFLLLKPRNVLRAAFLTALFALSYPALRAFDLIPADYLIETVAKYDTARAASFGGRLEEEEFVTGQIYGHRLFGRGNVARMPGALTFDIEGGGAGGLDGWWTIMLVSRGFVGMWIPFLLLAVPVFLARRRSKSKELEPMLPLIAGLMFIVGFRMVDLLMNGWWNHLPMFLSGALFGVMSRASTLEKGVGSNLIKRRRPGNRGDSGL